MHIDSNEEKSCNRNLFLAFKLMELRVSVYILCARENILRKYNENETESY